MVEKSNGQTPTQYELHRRQERMDISVAENTRRINELEKCQARTEARLNSISKTLETHSLESREDMRNLSEKIDNLAGVYSPDDNRRTDMMWGGMKLVGFVLVVLGAFSAAAVALFL